METLTEEATRYKKLYTGQWSLSPHQSRQLGTSHSSPSHHQLLCCIFLISLTVWNFFPFKGDFSFGKSQKLQGKKFGLFGNWVTSVIWCFTKKLCTRCDAWAGKLSWWSCQSPVVHSCSLLHHLNSFHGGMFKLNAKFGADLLLYLLSHFECEGHTVHMFTQQHLLPPLTSRVKSSLFTHVQSSPLFLSARLHGCCANHSCYINNGWNFSGQTMFTFGAEF